MGLWTMVMSDRYQLRLKGRGLKPGSRNLCPPAGSLQFFLLKRTVQAPPFLDLFLYSHYSYIKGVANKSCKQNSEGYVASPPRSHDL